MSKTSVFISVLVILMILERVFVDRRPMLSSSEIKRRYLNNIGLGIVSALIFALLPLSLVEFSKYLEQQQYSFLSLIFPGIDLNIPTSFRVFLEIMLLDFCIYLQHLITHKFKPLWKLHRIHHLDLHLDALSALRFHPLEIFLSFLFKLLLIYLFSISVQGILLFEILLVSFALFNHSNIKIPQRMEAFLQLFIITPKIHKVHHSDILSEHNSTYGTIFSWWDKTFKTLNRKDHVVKLGLKNELKEKSFKSLLILRD